MTKMFDSTRLDGCISFDFRLLV